MIIPVNFFWSKQIHDESRLKLFNTLINKYFVPLDQLVYVTTHNNISWSEIFECENMNSTSTKNNYSEDYYWYILKKHELFPMSHIFSAAVMQEFSYFNKISRKYLTQINKVLYSVYAIFDDTMIVQPFIYACGINIDVPYNLCLKQLTVNP